MSSTGIRALAALAIASALLLGALAGTAAAAKKTKVSATLQFSPPSHFSGKVSSKSSACKRKAPVSVRYFSSSADTTADVVGKGKADNKGNFAIEVPNAIAGQYQVKVAGRKVGGENCAVYVGLKYDF